MDCRELPNGWTGMKVFKKTNVLFAPTLLLAGLMTLVFTVTAWGSSDRGDVDRSHGIGNEHLQYKGEARRRKGPKRRKLQLKVDFVEGLSFGKVMADTAAEGRVVINPATGQKETYGSFDLGGNYHRGEIEVRGIPGKRFYVSLPTVVVLTSRGERAIRLTDFTVHPSNTGTLGVDGRAVLYLGATLTLRPSQQGARSKGRINVFVDYIP